MPSVLNTFWAPLWTQAWAGRAPKGSKQKPWVQFTFPSPQKINRIRLSTNREDYLSTDYLLGINKFNFGPYRVEALNPNGKWRQVAATGQLARLDKKHPPLDIERVARSRREDMWGLEEALTVSLMVKHGHNLVRGGGWNSPNDMKRPTWLKKPEGG